MSLVPAFRQLVAHSLAKASDVMHNLNLLRNRINGGLDQTNLDTTQALLNATMHGDLSGSADTMHTGESVELVDTDSHFSAPEVETALDEIGDALKMSGGSPTGGDPAKLIGYDYHATDETGMSVVIPANSGTTAIIVTITAWIEANGGTGNATRYLPIKINTTELSSQASPDAKFHLRHGTAGNVTASSMPCWIAYIDSTSYPALDMTIENTIAFGTKWDTTAGTGSISGYGPIGLKVEVI